MFCHIKFYIEGNVYIFRLILFLPMQPFNAQETSRRFNNVLDDVIAALGVTFDRKTKLLPSQTRKEVWYQAGRDIKIAYLPPKTHHAGVDVPSIHVRVYHDAWAPRIEEIYRRHGLKPEISDHEMFGKTDIDARL